MPAEGVCASYPRLTEQRAQELRSPILEEVVVKTATSYAVDVASLRARVRIALCCPDPDMDHNVYRIAEEQAEYLRKGHEAVAHLFISQSLSAGVNLRAAKLVRLSEETGCLIASAVHYLQSARLGSSHFALEDPQSSRLMAYASVSALDWDIVANALRMVADSAEHLTLSRIYVSEGAPRNTISRMLSLLVGEYAESGLRATISTTVDPNLGFAGTSYRASNWIEVYSIPHLGYMYIDGQFCTRRQLIRSFGSDNPIELTGLLGNRLLISGSLDSDTMVFATATSRELRLALQNMDYRRLERNGSQETIP